MPCGIRQSQPDPYSLPGAARRLYARSRGAKEAGAHADGDRFKDKVRVPPTGQGGARPLMAWPSRSTRITIRAPAYQNSQTRVRGWEKSAARNRLVARTIALSDAYFISASIQFRFLSGCFYHRGLPMDMFRTLRDTENCGWSPSGKKCSPIPNKNSPGPSRSIWGRRPATSLR